MCRCQAITVTTFHFYSYYKIRLSLELLTARCGCFNGRIYFFGGVRLCLTIVAIFSDQTTESFSLYWCSFFCSDAAVNRIQIPVVTDACWNLMRFLLSKIKLLWIIYNERMFVLCLIYLEIAVAVKAAAQYSGLLSLWFFFLWTMTTTAVKTQITAADRKEK